MQVDWEWGAFRIAYKITLYSWMDHDWWGHVFFVSLHKRGICNGDCEGRYHTWVHYTSIQNSCQPYICITVIQYVLLKWQRDWNVPLSLLVSINNRVKLQWFIDASTTFQLLPNAALSGTYCCCFIFLLHRASSAGQNITMPWYFGSTGTECIQGKIVGVIHKASHTWSVDRAA